MKKNLLLAAAMLLSTGAFADGITITEAAEAPFQFSNDNSYVYFFLGQETRLQKNLATESGDQVVDNDNLMYFGPDSDNGRNLWIWDGSSHFGSNLSDLNSMDVPGDYMSYIVGTAGWSGLGYNINKDNAVNLSFIDSNWTFHMAVKSQSKQTFVFTITDGTGKQAQLCFGDSPYSTDTGSIPTIGNFNRDGEWYNIDVPVGYLEDQFEFTFDGATKYTDKNYFVVLAGGVEGTTVDYDAVFFYGPKVDKSLIDQTEDTGVNAVRNTTSATDGVYNLAGQRTTAAKGIRIVKAGDSVRKVVVK